MSQALAWAQQTIQAHNWGWPSQQYIRKILLLQVSKLKRKQAAQSQLLRQKQKSDEVAKRLQEEIQMIKSQKVFLFAINCLI